MDRGYCIDGIAVWCCPAGAGAGRGIADALGAGGHRSENTDCGQIAERI